MIEDGWRWSSRRGRHVDRFLGPQRLIQEVLRVLSLHFGRRNDSFRESFRLSCRSLLLLLWLSRVLRGGFWGLQCLFPFPFASIRVIIHMVLIIVLTLEELVGEQGRLV